MTLETTLPELTLQEINGVGWCDAELESLAWIEDGRDLQLHVSLAGGEAVCVRKRVVYRWAERLSISLAFSDSCGGRPFSWEAIVDRLPDGRLSVAWDFASTGEIRLVCSSVEILDIGTTET